jgi:oligoribonuclease
MIAWVDVESTGTSADKDMILEVGGIITDMQGHQVGDEYTTLVNVDPVSAAIALADTKVRTMHDTSGLWAALWSTPSTHLNQVDAQMAHWIDTTTHGTLVLLGGNSPHLDRNLISVNLPATYSRLSHRSIDVTSIALMLQENTPISRYQKSGTHRALEDARDSLNEYRYYLTQLNGHPHPWA